MRKRLLIVDDDPAVGSALGEQLAGSQWLEPCGQAENVETAWRMLRDVRPDLVLLGGIREAERGVLCQQFRLAFPHLAYIAACEPRELAWEPFFRNLGIWVIAKPIQPGQLEALAMQHASLQVLPMGGVQAGGAPAFAAESGSAPGLHAVAEAKPVQPYRESRSSSKHLITVYGPKGGVGKTFLSRELAVYFSLQKRDGRPLRVLAVDFNLDLGTFATSLNLPRSPNLFTWVQDIDARLHELVRRHGKDPLDVRPEEWQEYVAAVQMQPEEVDKYVVTYEETGLHVLTSPRDIRHSFEIRDYHLYLMLETLKHSAYDVILIDTAPDTTDATIQALFFADRVVMVGNPIVDSIENIQRMLKLLREAEYPEERIQLCMNRIQKREMFTLDEIRAYFHLHPSKKIHPIPDDAEVKKSINTGTPMVLHPGRSAAKEAIEALGSILLPLDSAKNDSVKGKAKERPALLKWLWR